MAYEYKHCPKCGSHDIACLWLVKGPELRKKTYEWKCLDCGWRKDPRYTAPTRVIDLDWSKQ
jgi:predicted RNA-binding Zn-ribbon protein involved in translation (DUF1610 family)